MADRALPLIWQEPKGWSEYARVKSASSALGLESELYHPVIALRRQEKTRTRGLAARSILASERTYNAA